MSGIPNMAFEISRPEKAECREMWIAKYYHDASHDAAPRLLESCEGPFEAIGHGNAVEETLRRWPPSAYHARLYRVECCPFGDYEIHATAGHVPPLDA